MYENKFIPESSNVFIFISNLTFEDNQIEKKNIIRPRTHIIKIFQSIHPEDLYNVNFQTTHKHH